MKNHSYKLCSTKISVLYGKFSESLYMPKYKYRLRLFITDVTNSFKIMNRTCISERPIGNWKLWNNGIISCEQPMFLSDSTTENPKNAIFDVAFLPNSVHNWISSYIWSIYTFRWNIHIFNTVYTVRLGRYLYPAGNYMFKVNNRNSRTRCKKCSKLWSSVFLKALYMIQ